LVSIVAQVLGKFRASMSYDSTFMVASVRRPRFKVKGLLFQAIRAMMARLESGELSLTARMSDVFLRFRQTVLPGDAAFAQLRAKGNQVQTSHSPRLGHGKPAPRVVPAGEFNLHVPLAFPGLQGKTGQRGIVEIERDAHVEDFAGAARPVNAGLNGHHGVQQIPRPALRRLACVGLLVCAGVVASAAELRLGQAYAPPGSVVTLPGTCNAAPGTVAVQFDVGFDPAVVSVTGLAGGSSLAGHVVDQQLLAPGHWRALVYSTTNGPIAPGTMAQVQFAIATNAPDGDLPLVLGNAILAQANGQPVQPLALTDGLLRISSVGYFASATLDAGGHLELQFQGAEGRRYVLEASTNLTEWVAISTNTVVGGAITNAESDVQVFAQRFYRARLAP
jgi:hypothetical protein